MILVMRKLANLMVAIVLIAAVTAQAETKLRQRSEVETKYKWNLADIYVSNDAWEADFNKLKGAIGGFEKFKGTLDQSADNILACMKLRDSLGLLSNNLYVYANLLLDEDNRISDNQERSGRISGLNSQFSEATSFIEPEILAMDDAKLRGFINSNPALTLYKFELEDILRRKAHVLPTEQERLLALVGPVTSTPSEIFSMIDNADMQYGKVVDENGDTIQMTKERYYALLESSDRRLRKDANYAFTQGYVDHANSIAATLGASVKQDWFYAQARGYKTCLEMSLDGDNIPQSVFHNLIDAVNANLGPLHKWAALRKQMLKYDTLYNYDMSVPLLPDQKKEYAYEDAKKMVLAGLKPMGKEYLATFAKGLENRWIDVYENEGKGSGAYQWGTYATHPFVLLNFNGTLDAVFTLAHEMGHAMHSDYTNRHEPYVYSDHSLFVAEVASTCNEAVLMKYLLKNTKDKREKMALLNFYIEQIIGTFYTQVMFSEFELAIHDRIEKGDAISAEFLRKTYRDIYEKYWGKDLVLIEPADVTGMRIPHFYRQYYVFQYATCYAAAQMLSQQIMEKGDKFLPTYYQFISTGSSKYPVDILKAAGVDMTTPEPINRTISLFAELVAEMERLLKQG